MRALTYTLVCGSIFWLGWAWGLEQAPKGPTYITKVDHVSRCGLYERFKKQQKGRL